MDSNYFRLGWVVLALSLLAFAAEASPDCLSYNGTPLDINNQEVLHWKRTTQNQFQERAHVEGVVGRVFADHSGHHHFEIVLGNRDEDSVEIIYNEDFGAIPPPTPGMQVEACGDYITSTGRSGPYPPSPDGAIVHWVHRSNNPDRHPSGFLVMDGQLCGQEADRRGFKSHHAPNGGFRGNPGYGNHYNNHGSHHSRRRGHHNRNQGRNGGYDNNYNGGYDNGGYDN